VSRLQRTVHGAGEVVPDRVQVYLVFPGSALAGGPAPAEHVTRDEAQNTVKREPAPGEVA
jgi:hypothetical protein